MIEIDLTRAILAFMCGYFLTLSGSLSQIVTNNSLASPSTLGFDALAALSVIVSQGIIVYGGISYPLEFVSLAIFGFIFCGFIAISYTKGKTTLRYFSLDIKFLILTGLGFNLFVGAIFSIVQFLFMSLNWEFPSGLWFGNFRFFHEESVYIFGLTLSAILFYLFKNISQLRLLSLGEDIALGLGVNVVKAQRLALLVSLGLTGVVISFFGVFSFIGLIMPHMLRGFNFFNKSMRHELFIGPAVGGASLSIIDYFCFRFDFQGAEFPAGMVSSIVGALLLIVLLAKSQVKNFAKD
ncbi:MAG: iron chelate uptake ABC transporter family permease subunit [Bacteriovoracaceae bacterium]|nr:iron chelate uptake ABC transporter family permease subunit [Bacteriovoracaceae bacterium]